MGCSGSFPSPGLTGVLLPGRGGRRRRAEPGGWCSTSAAEPSAPCSGTRLDPSRARRGRPQPPAPRPLSATSAACTCSAVRARRPIRGRCRLTARAGSPTGSGQAYGGEPGRPRRDLRHPRARRRRAGDARARSRYAVPGGAPGGGVRRPGRGTPAAHRGARLHRRHRRLRRPADRWPGGGPAAGGGVVPGGPGRARAACTSPALRAGRRRRAGGLPAARAHPRAGVDTTRTSSWPRPGRRSRARSSWPRPGAAYELG